MGTATGGSSGVPGVVDGAGLTIWLSSIESRTVNGRLDAAFSCDISGDEHTFASAHEISTANIHVQRLRGSEPQYDRKMFIGVLDSPQMSPIGDGLVVQSRPG